MGPNGCGKSTLATTLLGFPGVRSDIGVHQFQGDDITDWGADIRGKAGIFLAFQHPMESFWRQRPELPAPGLERPKGHRDERAGTAAVPDGVDGQSWAWIQSSWNGT